MGGKAILEKVGISEALAKASGKVEPWALLGMGKVEILMMRALFDWAVSASLDAGRFLFPFTLIERSCKLVPKRLIRWKCDSLGVIRGGRLNHLSFMTKSGLGYSS